MVIVGGCYKEICECPNWNALFGSGVRAAMALVGISAHVDLHTYCHTERMSDLKELRARGITIHATPSANDIAFAYLHPLSAPGVAHGRSDISAEKPIIARGEVVVRFGFLEGDAVVEAERAIYDPQTTRVAIPFRENGSSAACLALVLNEHELRAAVEAAPIAEAAETLMARDDADVIVVKRGAQGASVFQRGHEPSWVPAWHTPRVFAIGSGDVFTAAFAYYWGIEKRAATDAAVLASKSTAAYCNSRELPIPNEHALPSFPAVNCNTQGNVCIIAGLGTLASYWFTQEARWCLDGLGRSAEIVDAVSGKMEFPPARISCALILADTLEDGGTTAIQAVEARDLPAVVLREGGRLGQRVSAHLKTTDDFSTALYWAAWT